MTAVNAGKRIFADGARVFGRNGFFRNDEIRRVCGTVRLSRNAHGSETVRYGSAAGLRKKAAA